VTGVCCTGRASAPSRQALLLSSLFLLLLSYLPCQQISIFFSCLSNKKKKKKNPEHGCYCSYTKLTFSQRRTSEYVRISQNLADYVNVLPLGETTRCIEGLVCCMLQSLEDRQAAGIGASLFFAMPEVLLALVPSHYCNTAGRKVMYRDAFLKALSQPTGQSH